MYLDTMPIITFIYYFPNDSSRYFGKFVSNRDLPEYTGIDAVVRNELVRFLNILEGEPYKEYDVDVGILSYTQDNAWTTYREVSAFDAYIEVRENGKYRRWSKGDRLYKRGC